MPEPRPDLDPGTRASARAAIAAGLRTLVIDDEPNIRQTLALCLRQLGCEVAQAASGGEAAAVLTRREADLAFLDLRLGAEDGLEVLKQLLAARPGLDVVMVTAYASIDTAVEAMRRGARDYLPKPFTPAQIRTVVERTRERRVLPPEGTGTGPAAEVRIETASPRMQGALQLLGRAAAHEVPVLLRGEPGTGKGSLARALHGQSARRLGPFVEVACSAQEEDRLDAMLFGGAAGSAGPSRGALESADAGTVFLDEVGDLPPRLQAKLDRYLMDGAVEQPGEHIPRARARLVVATQRDLEADVAAGRFLQALLYRLNVVEITVPALRDRMEDILPWARAYLANLAAQARRPAPSLSPAAETALLAWSWPGNLKELRNTVERALILAPGQIIEPAVLPERMLGRPGAGPQPGGDFTSEEIEREHVLRVLARAPTLAEASRILGVDVTTIWRKRKKWGR